MSDYWAKEVFLIVLVRILLGSIFGGNMMALLYSLAGGMLCLAGMLLLRKVLAEKETICAEDLWDKPLIVSHQTAASSEMSAWMKRDISKLNIVTTYDLIYNASHFVKKGFGYAIALDKLVNTTGESELCFRPLSPTLDAGLCIVWKKYQVFSRASEQFLRKIQKMIFPSE